MPRVPTYDNFQVQQNNLPNVQLRPGGARFDVALSPDQAASVGRGAAQMGQAISQTGMALSKIEAEEAERANQIRVNDAMNQAVKTRLDLTYKPGEGYTSLRGENALNRPDGKPLDAEYGDKLQQRFDEIAKGLGNDSQRVAFKRQADQLMQQFQGGITHHIAKEYGDYQVNVQDGTIKTGNEQMALAWSDPAAVQQARESIKAAVYAKGQLLGIPGKAIEAAQVEALSPGHAAVVTAAVDAGKLDYAREYLKQHDGELTPQARLQVTKLVDTGAFEQRTQDAAGELFAKHAGDITKALDDARKNFTGKDEDAIVTRLKTLESEQRVIRENKQKDAKDQAWKIYSDTGSLGKIPASIKSAMDGQDWETLRKNARIDAEGREVKTDPSIYYALTLASASDPKFKDEDLRRYRDKLSTADFKHFVDVQGKLTKGEDSAQVATATQQKDSMVKALGLKNEDAGVFHQEADKALFAAQSAKGRALDQTERQKVLDGLVLEGKTPGTLWDSSTRAFKARAEGKPFTPVWNDAQKNKATEALKRQGINKPTDQQIDATLRAVYPN
jgi:hypothetical protein